MGLFTSKMKKRAEKYLQIANELIGSIEVDTDIFPDYSYAISKRIYEALLALCVLLTASFCADPDASLEMIPVFQMQVLKHPITKEDYDSMTQRINKYYYEYRDAGIKIQETTKDWYLPFLDKVAELTENYFQIPHSRISSDSIMRHMQVFIQRSRDEVRK